MTSNGKKIAGAFAALALSVAASGRAGAAFADFETAWGPRYRLQESPPAVARQTQRSEIGAIGWVHHWNHIAIDASGLDHTPVSAGESRVFGEELGPGRSSRAMAIVHIAVFDAVNADRGRATRVTRPPPRPRRRLRMRAADRTGRARDAGALFPRRRRTSMPSSPRTSAPGRPGQSGRHRRSGAAPPRRSWRCARTTARSTPSRASAIDYITGNEPGEWRQDPISQHPARTRRVLGRGGAVRLESCDQFRVPTASGARQRRGTPPPTTR